MARSRAEIEALAAAPRVVAIGESGLDDYWTTRREDCASLEVQREAFAWHVDLAKRTGLPLVIHDREAHDALLMVVAGGYYIDQGVRQRLGYDGQQPVEVRPEIIPNYVEEGLIEPLLARGPIYRPADDVEAG